MSLPRRAGRLLTEPAAEWEVIAHESTDIPDIYSHYLAILAVIPAVAVLTGLALSAGRYLGRDGLMTAVTAAIVSYALGLALPLATALVLAALAPKFKSHGGTLETFKLVAYASTPYWLSSICYLLVVLSPLVVVGGLYAIYLFYLGLAPVMGVPLEQRVPFTLIATIVVLVTNIVLSWIVTFVGLPHYGF